ncbi:hypothetical protein DMENIID0001_050590 [Sergentomyia squamirostris]
MLKTRSKNSRRPLDICYPEMAIENRHLEKIFFGQNQQSDLITRLQSKRPRSPVAERQQKRPRGQKRNPEMPSKNLRHTNCKKTTLEKKDFNEKFPARKEWNREDVEKALFAEKEMNSLASSRLVIIRFPDPPITRELIHGYSPAIESVHFQQLLLPRYCFVKLHEDANVDETIKEISKIPFGSGTLTAELRNNDLKNRREKSPGHLDDVDPCTLYVGHLPPRISADSVKRIFKKAESIDLEPLDLSSQKIKSSRYALVHFRDADTAIEAFRTSFDLAYESRNLIVRFYRRKSRGDRVAENSSVPENIIPIQEDQELPTDTTADTTADSLEVFTEEIDDETSNLQVEESKFFVLEDAGRISESLSFPESSLTMPTPLRIKSEIPEIAVEIKTEREDQELEDRLYNQLVSTQLENPDVLTDQDDEESDHVDEEDSDDDSSEDEMAFENTSSQDRNPWDVLREEELNQIEEKHNPEESRLLLRTILPIHSSKNDVTRLISMSDGDFEDCDEPNDPEIDYLFNELNPDDLDEEEFQFSS